MTTGTHLLVNLYGCPAEKLEQKDIVLTLLNEIVSEAQLSKVGEGVHQFDPIGVTAFILLAESHISIHTWPEKDGFAAVDIYTCADAEKNERAFTVLCEKFKPQRVEKQRVDR